MGLSLEQQNKEDILILAIETSCDETAASVMKNGREVLSNAIYTQIALHTKYGGVVPETKAISFAAGLPLIRVHHISVNYFEHRELEPSFVRLVASGWHSHLVAV